jgi:hypothetical protein
MAMERIKLAVENINGHGVTAKGRSWDVYLAGVLSFP